MTEEDFLAKVVRDSPIIRQHLSRDLGHEGISNVVIWKYQNSRSSPKKWGVFREEQGVQYSLDEV